MTDRKKEKSPPKQGGFAWGAGNAEESEEIKSFDNPAAPLKKDNGSRDRSSNRFEAFGKAEKDAANTSMHDEEENKPASVWG